MAGFASGRTADPVVEMAGFESGSPADPGVEMAGAAAARYLATVPRSIPSFRAMSRPDVPLWAKTMIACCKFTLS